MNPGLARSGANSPSETRDLLLQAAGEVFAEHGFRNATVREICLRAGANIAAVNYHFGDKETLYTEVLRYAHRLAIAKYPPTLGLAFNAPAEERLQAFVRSFLLRIFDEGKFAWRGKLLSREMIDPTDALDSLVREEVLPMAQELRAIVSQLLRRPQTDELLRNCCSSIVGQCVFFHHCQPLIQRLTPDQSFAPEEVEKLAAHITHFSLSALQSF